MDNLERLIAALPRPEAGEGLDQRIAELVGGARQPVRPRRRPLPWLVGVAAAVAIAAVSLWGLRPDPIWAQVAAALETKPWIHLKTEAGEGRAPIRQELWLSLPREVVASRREDPGGKEARFVDLRSDILHQYDERDHRLMRLPSRETDEVTLRFFAALFQGLAYGKPVTGGLFADDRIVDQSQRPLNENGRDWIELELKLERGAKPVRSTAVIRADAQTKLPESIEITSEQGSIYFAVDYPADGPADIYALGVPRDTPLDDRVPGLELAGIIRSLKAGRDKLDNYFAAMTGDTPAQVVWRKGDKWRIELWPPTAPLDKMPTDEAQLAQWWRKQIAEHDGELVAVCDGQNVYRRERRRGRDPEVNKQPVRWPGNGHLEGQASGANLSPALIELLVYPFFEPSPNPKDSIVLDSKGTNGPAGSVLVEVIFDRQEKICLRFWLDPNRGCVALQREQTTNGQVVDHVECDEFRQSPQGIWYPTVVRTITPDRRGARPPKADEQDAVDRTHETHYFLDFSAELPDELFTPSVRKKGVRRPFPRRGRAPGFRRRRHAPRTPGF